ncbi:hypothetical protein BDP81DRAFT_512586 [Colletotrichum phormii]|uniref:Uncharacterized protein n=1 Tax=Colletotrichum phormii TaxID=359342 RepID=A0AAI9ZWK7_9PEZI|nr:uncharacterized protein BDP81DRAFT_512586 [Colletotrichum phormii]KAK1639545.1 hypothetical protein BDP81DRAFT_512586 [Colletotrichum phormii]
MVTLSRNPADIQAETDAGYNLAKISDFKPSMSVQEKLSLGIRMGLQRRDAVQTVYQQTRDRESRNNAMALGGIELTDHALALPMCLRQNLNETISDTKISTQRLTDHIETRMPFIKEASSRLTAALRPCVKTLHTIQGLVARRRPGQIMNTEWQDSCNTMSMNMSFSAFQARSMRLNGYRRRAIQWIHFQRVGDSLKPFPGPPLDDDIAEDNPPSSTTEMFFEHGRKHELSLVELDITDINGAKHRWICIEIAQPLAQVRGPAPIELTPMPQSFIKIAMPAENVLELPSTRQHMPNEKEQPNKNHPPQLGDFEKLTIGDSARSREDVKMRLRVCRNGMPIFVTGSKKGHIPDSSPFADFLSAPGVTGLPWKETDKRVGKNTVLLRKREFWQRFFSAAEIDKERWASLQDAMARDECIVDITFKDQWQEFAPVVQASLSKWASFQPQSPQSAHRPQTQGLHRGFHNRREGNAVPPRSSGLRNEVRW